MGALWRVESKWGISSGGGSRSLLAEIGGNTWAMLVSALFWGVGC